MNLLLDTHVLLWWLSDDTRLGDQARGAIADARSRVWVSAASAWEVVIKAALGRLELPGPPAEVVPAALTENDFTPLPISIEHALGVGHLPAVHSDPFDRILIAQAIAERLTLVTADVIFARYPVPVLPA
ncbi:MAG: type II toxin-antitoxin system VapC family toxin [Rhodospirillales bacterium]